MSDKPQGLLLVDKPSGPTSHDIVDAARKALRQRRIGHTGTLDPAATGLLLLCVGKATRLQHYLLSWPKVYSGEIRLGFATTTYDAEGERLGDERPVPTVDAAVIADLTRRFTGEQDQLPPPYSAKKTGGKKYYELARAGEEVPREPKRVTIHDLSLEGEGDDRLRFVVSCSSGTYVRSLAHDIGEVLHCGGHLASLRRERIGPWSVAEAVPADVLATRPQDVPDSAFVPLSATALPYPEVSLNPTAASNFAHGQDVVVRDADGDFVPGREVVVRDRSGELVGIGVTMAFMPRARTLNLAPRMVLMQVEGRGKP